ncbi:SERINE/THREONINE-PROTEIN KINASE UNC-51-RELATED [Salix viminalis]|uniref:SERINE/THREONINE-PROTEIN KINASE UNC-51-RELATED n=1 Tax=Salix viminalis TaxID=40686 RepID=A0A9Q0V5A0_SALVM|nr:SERINE/THREONINE-PROTEIN KINASE UNC-51-RELATED [Salix viminalis]
MAQASGRSGRVVGDYLVGRQIGSGSFSVVWHARHRVHGTEVAIKEIVTNRLSERLQESLMSEIFILKRINHPNIVRLHDIIEVPGRILIVLEYCKGGDLSMYIQRHGKVPEAIAKHFMQQLAAGLQILRDNNLIHRDLKPQNLLLSMSDNNEVLKIADFGFARSLQPSDLAETMCGSPLYMAPEIMQLQKYDAKADLWSVGAILFQLVTGKTPYTGNNQLQLLQNVVKSTELQFPLDNKDLSAGCKDLCRKLLRPNPVERLTFEEFFNHPFLSPRKKDELLRSSRSVDGFPFSGSNPARNADDDSSGPEGSPSISKRMSPLKSTYGFSLDSRIGGREATSNVFNNVDLTSRYVSARQNLENASLRPGIKKASDENLNEPPKPIDQRSGNIRSRGSMSSIVDSLDLIEQDYVLVSGPPLDVLSSTATTSKPRNAPYKSESPSQAFTHLNSMPSIPMPIIGTANNNLCRLRSLEISASAPGTSEGSMVMGDASEQPSSHCMTRIKSLQHCASALTELMLEKINAGRQLEAFSIQLVILAIWKQALHICHTQAASAIEGSPSQKSSRLRRRSSMKHGTPDTEDCPDVGPENMSTRIEGEFLQEVDRAEELAKAIKPGSMEMPDAMETIFQSALSLGRHGGVDELIGNMENAALLYSRAERLLVFLLVEAPSLVLNPPFSLTNSDRYRLRRYIDVLNNRQEHSRSQRMALLKCEDQQSPP